MKPIFISFALAWTCATTSVAADSAAAHLDLARQLNAAFVEVAERVSPAVVVINVIQKNTGGVTEEMEQQFEELPPELKKYFRRRLQEHQPDTIPGQGSGIIIREDGFILTNAHVVEDAEKIDVRLHDGRRFKGIVRGIDPRSDLAVIKITANGLPVATLADSNLTKVGEFTIAIGTPFSLDYSVTCGHVSAKGRSNVLTGPEGVSMDQDFIQTDANINPGNSGGPLLNIEGQVIGVNTLIRGLHSGIGFAVPSSLAREVSDQLIATGKFTRSWLGIQIRAVRDDSDFQEAHKNIKDGVIVSGMVSDGPASKSELKRNDIILTVDGAPVASAQELRGQIRNKHPGQPVVLDVSRDGKSLKIKVLPEEWVQAAPVTLATDRRSNEGRIESLGLTVRATPAPESDTADKISGLEVIRVERDSLASAQDIKRGDLIVAVTISGHEKSVKTAKDLREAALESDLKKGLSLKVTRDKSTKTVVLKTEK
jgi:serine protease Do